MIETSDEDEELHRFREAVDPEFSTKLIAKESDRTKTSLRPKRDEDEQFNLFDVTPQFQHYVAKRLSSILDKQLEKRLVNVNTPFTKKKTKNRVKLFRNSDKYLKPHKEVKVVRKCQSESDNSDDYTKYNEAAIDHMNTTNWSTNTKGKVFRYTSDTNGTLSLISMT